ncbi:hypothetical protein KY290_017029 [Solanum tuberosum]|uniref:Uncharacterized protein n=1 Tax=Solanum tuberosum TaxID=4113 RepID=A0ABQ7VBZ6_SOLTU|nr:hypothetical protein KY285_016084 [Solanum tuberosum]KAH0760956.1 hypothetical protein KY290_017029 [Solanum tuberosum]
MYDDKTGTLAQARTLNLNVELGQYGTRASDVKLAAAKQLAETWAMAEWSPIKTQSSSLNTKETSNQQ